MCSLAENSQAGRVGVPGKCWLTVFPYVHGVTDRTGRLLIQHSVRPIFKPIREIQQFLGPVKDDRDPLLACLLLHI